MQPYFMPYAGYFRLFAVTDLFVALDCVQFPRRGWVHRNRLTDEAGNLQWFTLPLQKADRDTTRICDLHFRASAQTEWLAEARRFPALTTLRRGGGELAEVAFDLGGSPVDYLIRGMRYVARTLGVEREIIRSSELQIAPTLRAQERILEVVHRVGGTEYVNAPGGRGLYNQETFEEAGVKLRFLADYKGPVASMLERLTLEDSQRISEEFCANLQLES